MRGLNVVAISGNVGAIEYSKTAQRQDEVCTFILAIEKARDRLTWVRVNVYGGAVQSCREHLHRGLGVMVKGELMNRQMRENLVTEIRCEDIKFIHSNSIGGSGSDEAQR